MKVIVDTNVWSLDTETFEDSDSMDDRLLESRFLAAGAISSA